MARNVKSATMLVGAWLLCLSAPLASFAQDDAIDELALIPWPHSLQQTGGDWELPPSARIIVADDGLQPLAQVLQADLVQLTGRKPEIVSAAAKPGDIVLDILKIRATGPRRQFNITVRDRAILAGSDYEHVCHAISTLLQLIRIEHEEIKVPQVVIEDRSDLAYNGAMLDVARKPYSLETLRMCIDVCRFYKIRYLQLHMTDENAWTFPSAAFPKLGSQNFAWAGGEAPTAYRREDLKELVKFAVDRGVIIVPEIEMPGHSGQLRGTYPEIFGYFDAAGNGVPVGVINMTSPKARAGLETLISEAAEIFSTSPFIHLGCDEASLGGLDGIPEVKEFMAAKKLPNVEAVFNDFVHQMNAAVVKQGKHSIMWEGVPNGPLPLPKSVLFMPWVGGSTWASELVAQGYNVINAPWGTATPYFDPYLVNGAQLQPGEPKLFGATSILWEAPEDRALPYLRFTGALRSEPTRHPRSGRNYDDFLKRWPRTDARLNRLLFGFSVEATNAIPQTTTRSATPIVQGDSQLSLSASFPASELRFTVDGTEPTATSSAYDSPIPLTKTTLVQARRFVADGRSLGPLWKQDFRKLTEIAHSGVGKSIVAEPDNPGYFGPGPAGLLDGNLAAGNNFDQAGWVGWQNFGQPIRLRIDLGEVQAVKNIGLHSLRSFGGVFPPREVLVRASVDGTDFKDVATIANAAGMANRGWFRAEFDERSARFIELVIAHDRDWTFFDEIVINGDIDQPTVNHAARGAKVTLKNQPSSYVSPGVAGLTDGYVSEEPNFLSLEYLGFDGQPLIATIDLGESRRLESVGARFLQEVNGGIFIPSKLEIEVSDDGREFRSIAREERKPTNKSRFIETWLLPMEATSARYVRLTAGPAGQWLFVDEILVNPEK